MDKEHLKERLDNLSKELNSIIEELGDNEPAYEEQYYSEDRITWISMPNTESRYALAIEKNKLDIISSNEIRITPISPNGVPPYVVFINDVFKAVEREAKKQVQIESKDSNSTICVKFLYNLRIEEWTTKPK